MNLKTANSYIWTLSAFGFYYDLKHIYKTEKMIIIPTAAVFLIKFAFHLSVIDG